MIEVVEEEVHGLKRNKAQGQDSFTTKFYQYSWKFIGNRGRIQKEPKGMSRSKFYPPISHT